LGGHLHVRGGGARGDSRGASDSERVGGATASAEDADRARSTRIRVSGVQDQAREAASVAAGQDPQWCPIGSAVCVSAREIDPALHGSGAPAYQATRTAHDRGVDQGIEPGVAGMGTSLQASPRPKALQPDEPLDCAANPIPSISPLAECGLETVAGIQVVWGVRACEPGATDSIIGISGERVFVKAVCGKTACTV